MRKLWIVLLVLMSGCYTTHVRDVDGDWGQQVHFDAKSGL